MDAEEYKEWYNEELGEFNRKCQELGITSSLVELWVGQGLSMGEATRNVARNLESCFLIDLQSVSS